MGSQLGNRIAQALDFTARLAAGLEAGRKNGSAFAVAPQRPLLAFATLACLLFAFAPAAAAQTPIDSGVAYLVDSQAADGSWDSSVVRRGVATAEAVRALQAVGDGALARGDAADLLATGLDGDVDALSRTLVALAGEGRDVSAQVGELVSSAAPNGGWGLTAEFSADPLDTALALERGAPVLHAGGHRGAVGVSRAQFHSDCGHPRRSRLRYVHRRGRQVHHRG